VTLYPRRARDGKDVAFGITSICIMYVQVPIYTYMTIKYIKRTRGVTGVSIRTGTSFDGDPKTAVWPKSFRFAKFEKQGGGDSRVSWGEGNGKFRATFEL